MNNYDLVPQVPFRWTDTKNLSYGAVAAALIVGFFSGLAGFAAGGGVLYATSKDTDDDNFTHHGNLVQLITVSKNLHHPGKVEQVLLTPGQTHITTMSLVPDPDGADSFRLADVLSTEYRGNNGVVATISDSGMDHMMGEYVPNLKSQIILLNEPDALEVSYKKAINLLNNREGLLDLTLQRLDIEIDKEKNKGYVSPVHQAYIQIMLNDKRDIKIIKDNISYVKHDIKQLSIENNTTNLYSNGTNTINIVGKVK